MSEFKLYAVAGNPIMLSRSPQIYNMLFRHFKMNAHYTRLASISAQEALTIGKEMKLCGLNLTAPFKEQAVPLVHELSPDAKKIKAVNLVLFRGSRLSGSNTDPYGVISALKENGVSIHGKKCAVLGAGGAGKAAVYGLMQARAARIILLNRTKAKAEKAAHDLGCAYAPLEQMGGMIQDCDILISCVPHFPESLYGLKWPLNLNFLDADYKHSLPECLTGQKKIKTISGLDWLLFQAFLSFQILTGKDIPGNIKASIKKNLGTEQNAHRSNIALIGFMGAGKTAVGRALAEKIQFKFIDTDSLIEEYEGLSISEIFEKKGEHKFREIEKALVCRILAQSKKTVFSLGGGAVLNAHAVAELKRSCRIIWLWTP